MREVSTQFTEALEIVIIGIWSASSIRHFKYHYALFSSDLDFGFFNCTVYFYQYFYRFHNVTGLPPSTEPNADSADGNALPMGSSSTSVGSSAGSGSGNSSSGTWSAGEEDATR